MSTTKCQACGRDELDVKVNDKDSKECTGCNRESKYCDCEPLNQSPSSGGGGGGVGGDSSYSEAVLYGEDSEDSMLRRSIRKGSEDSEDPDPPITRDKRN